MNTKYLSFLAGLLIYTSTAQAEIAIFKTGETFNDAGKLVNAQATFTTGAGSIEIVLENFQANPTDVTQVIYGLIFQLSNPDGSTINSSTATLNSVWGILRNVSKDGTFVDRSLLPTNVLADEQGSPEWGLNKTSNGGIYLDTLGFSGPDTGIIGAPAQIAYDEELYLSANGSIDTSKSHNPFIALSATFLLSVTGVTADTKVDFAEFAFGTSRNVYKMDYEGEVLVNQSPVPELSSMLVWGGVATAAGLARFGRRRKVA